MHIVDTSETTSWIVTAKVVQHLIKCMDYHQLKIVILQIDYTIGILVVEKLK